MTICPGTRTGSRVNLDARSELARLALFATGSPPMSEPTASPNLANAALVSALRRSVLPFLRSAAGWLTWGFAVGLLLTLAWMEWNAERLWLTGVLLFAPAHVLLLPMLLIAPFTLFLRPRLLIVHAAVVAVFFFGYVGVRWKAPPSVREGELRIITHNAGQGSRPQFYAFADSENPDVITLQDARGRGPELAKRYPGRHIAAHGEFAVVSRFPVLRSAPVGEAKWFGRPVSARFELACGDRPLALYSVHLPTPRNQLNRFLSGRAFADMVADEGGPQRRFSYTEWTRARLKLAQDVAAVVAAEKLPFIVCGDFNTPDHGVIYHTIARGLVDAQARSGGGWGFTFPGYTRDPLSLGRPWLRIDYAFAGRGWRPVWAAPEPGRRSQHCAVLARFVPESR